MVTSKIKKTLKVSKSTSSNKKEVIGLVERVIIKGAKGKVARWALFDTGATSSSVDMKVAAKAGLGPVVSSVRIKNASAPNGFVRRPVVEGIISLKDKDIKVRMNIEDRSGLDYAVLVGRDVIHGNFLIDLSKTHTSKKLGDMKSKIGMIKED